MLIYISAQTENETTAFKVRTGQMATNHCLGQKGNRVNKLAEMQRQVLNSCPDLDPIGKTGQNLGAPIQIRSRLLPVAAGVVGEAGVASSTIVTVRVAIYDSIFKSRINPSQKVEPESYVQLNLSDINQI